ncbi:hypothetical protein V8C40DRAFT_30872 [Trichoderma camerunense]
MLALLGAALAVRIHAHSTRYSQDSPSSQLHCPYYSVSQAESMRLCSCSVHCPSPVPYSYYEMDEDLYGEVLLARVTLVNRRSLILGGGESSLFRAWCVGKKGTKGKVPVLAKVV